MVAYLAGRMALLVAWTLVGQAETKPVRPVREKNYRRRHGRVQRMVVADLEWTLIALVAIGYLTLVATVCTMAVR